MGKKLQTLTVTALYQVLEFPFPECSAVAAKHSIMRALVSSSFQYGWMP